VENGGSVLTVLLDWSGRREKRWRDLEPSSLLTPLDALLWSNYCPSSTPRTPGGASPTILSGR
jgi:hypothetical protein